MRDLLDDVYVAEQLRELCELYREPARPVFESPFAGDLMAYGLIWSHVHQSVLQARAVLLLREHGLMTQTLPNVRLIFECGITVVWLARDKTRASAVGFEHARSVRVRMERALKESMGSVTQTDVDSWAAAAEAHRESRDAGARIIEQRFADVVAGPGMYAIYRALCGMSHAGGELADNYLHMAESGDPAKAAIRALPEGREIPGASYLGMAAIGLLMGLAVLDAVSPSSDLKKRLTRLGKGLEFDIGKFMHKNGIPWSRKK